MKNARINVFCFRLILFNLQIFSEISWSQPMCNRSTSGAVTRPNEVKQH